MENYSNNGIAYLFHQKVELNIDVIKDKIDASTTLYLGYNQDIHELPSILLHCRHYCKISKITVNNLNAIYEHNDSLEKIMLNSNNITTYTGEEIDVLYRSSLEINRNGELLIKIPDELYNKNDNNITSIKDIISALPSNSPRDISKQHNKITSICNNLRNNNNSTLLIIKIEYKLDNSNIGIAFHRSHNFTDSKRFKKDIMYNACSCIHTINNSLSSLRDLDGVRCWLPSIDSPDQRAIFDFNVTIDDNLNYYVLSSGRLVSKLKSPINNKINYRFFTLNKIPVMNIGFFIGKVEYYKTPLYRTQGVILVATYIQDFIIKRNIKKDKQDEENETSSRIYPGLKKQRIDNNFHNDYDTDNISNYDYTNLYSDLVKHTTIGLDLGIRAIHKLINKKYEYTKYIQIFVPNLISNVGMKGKFCCFDGFSLLDGSILHSKHQYYKESPSHLIQLSAYVYSWLKTSLPIDSYTSEFIIHGTVGYILNTYAEHLFGEEEGLYRVQKLIDSVVNTYKLGRNYSIVPFYPENFETLTPYYDLLLVNKSTLLFHILENKLEGKEKMRQVLDAIIKSPPLYHPKILAANQIPTNTNTSNDVSSLFPPTPRSENGSNSEPPTPLHMEPPTPYRFDASTPFREYEELVRVRSTSIDITLNTPSPSMTSIITNNNNTGSMLPPSTTTYKNNQYMFNDTNVLSQLTNECVTTENFTSIIRNIAGPSVTSFFDSFLFDKNFFFFRGDVEIKTTNDKKYISVIIEPICIDDYGGSDISLTGELRIKLVERIDDFTTDVTVNMSTKIEEYSKLLHSRPSKKAVGRPRLERDEDNIIIRDKDTKKEEVIVDTTTKIELERKKSAITCARETEYPIKLILFDPYMHILHEKHINCADSILIEQLFSSIDEKDIFRHIQALRSISRSNGNSNARGLSLKDYRSDKMTKLQLKAMNDCLLGNSQINNGTSSTTSKHQSEGLIENPHCYHTRAEAALALAQWQNENASKNTDDSIYLYNIINKMHYIYYPTYDSPWQGLGFLIDSLKSMYLEQNSKYSLQNNQLPNIYTNNNDTLDGNTYYNINEPPQLIPSINNFSNEGATYLRNAILIALSSIKAQNGYTPSVITNVLISFIENNTNISMIKSNVNLIDTHYKSILLLCLSKVNIDPTARDCNYFNQHYNNVSHEIPGLVLIDKIVSIADYILNADKTLARASARINYTEAFLKENDHNFRYFMPLTECDGLLTSAAITCLHSVDNQVLKLQARSRSLMGKLRDIREKSLFLNAVYVLHNVDTHVILYPTGIGEYSSIDYVDYFLPENCILQHSRRVESRTKNHTYSSLSLCPSLVRQAALEAFVRDCFTLHLIYSEKMKSNSTLKEEYFLFLPAALEAINQVITYDPCKCCKNNASMLLFDVLQDRPLGRCSWSSVTLGDLWHCIMSSDINATTLFNDSKQNQSKIFKTFINGLEGSTYLRNELKKLWQLITMNSAIDQTTKSMLVIIWIYAFPTIAPKCLTADSSYNDMDVDIFFDGSIHPNRLLLKNSFESMLRIETIYRFGSNYSISNSVMNEYDTHIESKESIPPLKLSLSLSATKKVTDNKDEEPFLSNIKRSTSLKIVFNQ